MYESIGYETYSESKAFKMVRKVNFSSGTIKEVSTPDYEDTCRV
jgi:hypothetical protein